MQTVLNSTSIPPAAAAAPRQRQPGFSWGIPAMGALAMAFAIVSVVKLEKKRVTAAPPELPPISAYSKSVAAVGLVEANTENIALSVPVAGWVTEVHALAGDRVKAGQRLFCLDHRDLDAELAMRKAQLAQALAHVPTADSDLADAELLWRDAARLDTTRVISREEAERKKIAAAGARARLAEAKTQVALAEAQIRQTEVAVERLTVISPIDGEVLQSDVRPGQYAPSGPLAKPLMILGNIEPLHVRVDIDEQDAWKVRAGEPATGAIRGAGDQRMKLSFVRFEPYVIPKVALTGDSTERTDTRVMQAIYRIKRTPDGPPIFVGQQMDVFIDSSGTGAGTAARLSKK
jgi:RND family efflux transporter MFP subunit